MSRAPSCGRSLDCICHTRRIALFETILQVIFTRKQKIYKFVKSLLLLSKMSAYDNLEDASSSGMPFFRVDIYEHDWEEHFQHGLPFFFEVLWEFLLHPFQCHCWIGLRLNLIHLRCGLSSFLLEEWGPWGLDEVSGLMP